jgi:hypothetical protein
MIHNQQLLLTAGMTIHKSTDIINREEGLIHNIPGIMDWNVQE